MFGHLLREARTRAGLTQKELAQKTGTSFQFVSKIEADERSVSLDTLRRLDKALHFPTKTLLHIIRCGEGGTSLALCAAVCQSLASWAC